jgi:hypothetical protein
MCSLGDSVRSIVRSVLRGLVEKNAKFTGYDVYKLYLEATCDVAHPALHAEISSYVRELFNSGEEPMLGYGATNVTPQGPVLYFRPHRYVLDTAESLRRTIHETPRARKIGGAEAASS